MWQFSRLERLEALIARGVAQSVYLGRELADAPRHSAVRVRIGRRLAVVDRRLRRFRAEARRERRAALATA